MPAQSGQIPVGDQRERDRENGLKAPGRQCAKNLIAEFPGFGNKALGVEGKYGRDASGEDINHHCGCTSPVGREKPGKEVNPEMDVIPAGRNSAQHGGPQDQQAQGLVSPRQPATEDTPQKHLIGRKSDHRKQDHSEQCVLKPATEALGRTRAGNL